MWPFKKKEVPQVPQVPQEPRPPTSRPIRIDSGFPEYATLAASIEFSPPVLLREILRKALGNIGVREFQNEAVLDYLVAVSRLRGTQYTFRWLRSKDERAAKKANPSSNNYQVARRFVPRRALELVKRIEEKLGPELPKIEVKLDDGTDEHVPYLIFGITVIPKGDGEEVFLAVQDARMELPDTFICSWKNDDSLEYQQEGAGAL